MPGASPIAQITSIGEFALQTLQAKHGEIIAVFNSSLYLANNHESLCCIGNPQLPQGPLNAISTLPHTDGLTRGDHWQFNDGNLMLARHCILATANTRIWKPAVPAIRNIDAHRRHNITELIEQTLHDSPPTTDTDVAMAIHNRLTRAERALTHWLADSKNKRPEFVASLLGCGEGLTPAGDDILLGAMVTLDYFSVQPQATILADCITRLAPGKTNRISRAHLSVGCTGQANALLHQLLDSCVNETNSIVKSCIDQLVNYGHSSGLYTLRGVKAGLTLAGNSETS